jgi:hypothetical protein
MKLNTDDVVVTSFQTEERSVKDPATDPVTIDTDEPTPATHCYVCPEDTPKCW